MNEDLRQIPLFASLSNDQFNCIDGGTDYWLDSGETLFRQGENPEYFYIILEGAVRISREVGGQILVLATYEKPMFFGEVPLLAGTPHLASGLAVGKTHVYCLKEDNFWRMLTVCPSLRRSVLGCMADRMQELQVLSGQREKLVSLGTMAAGLAHELNNPAGAAKRASSDLLEATQSLSILALDQIKQHLTSTQLEYLLALQQEASRQIATPSHLDPFTQSEREEELNDWLELHGIDDMWRSVPTLVTAGLNAEKLAPVCAHPRGSDPSQGSFDYSKVVTWLEATLATTSLLEELKVSTDRISDLVKAVKVYSYMDEALVQDVDVHEGIDNTLTILGHKLKGGVIVTREYDPSLPRIWVYGSEINQVWTNIIDNAIDAMGGQGQIWIRTAQKDSYVLVEITDNGPGIPTEIQSRIFEPFFTTKAVGKGTGLGLDTSYRTIQRHQGDIYFSSKPGETRFFIQVPIKHHLAE